VLRGDGVLHEFLKLSECIFYSTVGSVLLII